MPGSPSNRGTDDRGLNVPPTRALPTLLSLGRQTARRLLVRARLETQLGPHTHRVAVVNHRLIEVGNGQVRLTYRNRRRDNRLQIMTLSAVEFISRFLLHVLPWGFQRLRHVGFLTNRLKAGVLSIIRELLGVAPEPPKRETKTAAEWVWQLTGTDVTKRPQCG